MTQRYFTLEQANTLVATLAPRVKDAVRMHAALRQTSVTLLQRGHRLTERILAGKETLEVTGADRDQLEQAQAMYELMVKLVRRIEKTGARVKGVSEGLLDFPALLNGTTEVLLCWRLGESTIQAFHEPDKGFAGRKPIDGHTFVDQPS